MLLLAEETFQQPPAAGWDGLKSNDPTNDPTVITQRNDLLDALRAKGYKADEIEPMNAWSAAKYAKGDTVKAAKVYNIFQNWEPVPGDQIKGIVGKIEALLNAPT